MKKGLLAVFVVFIGVTTCVAWEYPKNPDRFPSIGLNLTSESGDSEVEFPSSPSLGSQDYEGSGASLVLDTRLPLSNSFTLNMAIGGASSEMKADETPTLNSSKQTSSTGMFRIGFRYYFNK